MAGGAGNNRLRNSGPQGSGNGQQQYFQPSQPDYSNASGLQQRQQSGPPQRQYQQQVPHASVQMGPRPRSGGYDGPGEPSGPPRQNPFGPGLGYDPAKPVTKVSVITNTRIELPPAAYNLENNVS